MAEQDEVVVYYNPRCSKCRQVLSLLASRGIRPRLIEYLKNPPSTQELAVLLGKLDMQPRQLMRTSEQVYRQAGLDDPGLTDVQLIDALVRLPILMQRPVIVAGEKALIGRPPEAVLEIL